MTSSRIFLSFVSHSVAKYRSSLSTDRISIQTSSKTVRLTWLSTVEAYSIRRRRILLLIASQSVVLNISQNFLK